MKKLAVISGILFLLMLSVFPTAVFAVTSLKSVIAEDIYIPLDLSGMNSSPSTPSDVFLDSPFLILAVVIAISVIAVVYRKIKT